MVGTSPDAWRPAPLPTLPPSRHERRARTPKNVSRNRPDATNLNHQNANRRIFMALSCNAVVALQIVPNAASKCELLHILTGETKRFTSHPRDGRKRRDPSLSLPGIVAVGFRHDLPAVAQFH